MISVIIPVLNEGNTIRQVIQLIRQTQKSIEIIVVDDNSSDQTVELALQENVRVITSSQRGKGISMREGLMAAKREIVVYVDGDITTYPPNLVDLLCDPIMNGDADFVKSYFDRQAGRVTELVAKPLLSILFPDLTHFKQPLSGMVAARKSLLQSIHFENDYGVDIGLLLDVHMRKARIQEVNIGKFENAMQTWKQLSKMSREVSRTILQRAETLPNRNLETLGQVHMIREQMEHSILESIDTLEKVVIFNLDAVVFREHFFEAAARLLNIPISLNHINYLQDNPVHALHQIVTHFKDRNVADILEVADQIPITPDIRAVIRALKDRGYACGFVTDGFAVVAQHIMNKLGADFAFANRLHLSNSVALGTIQISPYFLKNGDVDQYERCALLSYIENKFSVPRQNIIYVGNGAADLSLIEQAGIGISYHPSDAQASDRADHIIINNYLAPMLQFAQLTPSKEAYHRKLQKWKQRLHYLGWGGLAMVATGCLILIKGRGKQKSIKKETSLKSK
jgi:glucosyl-3-phosphoglycerate synthase